MVEGEEFLTKTPIFRLTFCRCHLRVLSVDFRQPPKTPNSALRSRHTLDEMLIYLCDRAADCLHAFVSVARLDFWVFGGCLYIVANHVTVPGSKAAISADRQAAPRS